MKISTVKEKKKNDYYDGFAGQKEGK